MAFIVFNDNRRPKAIKDVEKSHHIWRVLIGEAEPDNEAQAEFVAAIKRMYLNPENAPESYLRMYPSIPESYAATMGARNV